MIKELEKVLKAVANRKRLEILKFLKNSDAASVGEIAEHIKLSFRSTSRHLSVLNKADIVQYERDGLNVNYSISDKPSSVVNHILNLI